MNRNYSKLAILLGLMGTAFHAAHADAVMRSTDANYPVRLLRHTVTEVSADIHGLVAETRAFSEFKNDWDRATDAVYSFPLPADAHATRLLYSIGDSVIEAALKEIPQTTVPGTGEGGFAAELGEYLGKNKVTLQVRAIPAGGVAKIELRYVQKLDLEAGRIAYAFPLATQPYLVDALNQLSVTVKVWKPWNPQSWDSRSHPQGWTVVENDAAALCVKREAAKAFLESDLDWGYAPATTDFSVAFQSSRQSDSAGFAMASALPPMPTAAGPKTRNVLFLLDKSRSMSGSKLQQGVDAVKACLPALASADMFAIGVFDYNASLLTSFQSPTTDAKAAAVAKLDSLAKSVGASASNLTSGLNGALRLFPAGGANPQAFLFSDGLSEFAPGNVANAIGAPVFAMGLGRDANRARLEAAGAIGGGLTAYFREDEAIAERSAALFQAVSAPVLTAAVLSAPNGRLSGTTTDPASAGMWNWGGITLAARYTTAGPLDFTLQGMADSTPISKSFQTSLASDTSQTGGLVSMRYWATEQIRALENQIDLAGMNSAARQEAVRLSLLYKVKCRYTSYQAESEATPAGDPGVPILTSLRDGKKPSEGSLQIERLAGSGDIAIRIGSAGAGMDFSLAIYDMHGRLLRRLTPEGIAGDGARFLWNGLDGKGMPVRETVLIVVRLGNRAIARALPPRFG